MRQGRTKDPSRPKSALYQLGSGRMFRGIVCGPTAVTVSIHRTNGSEVRYLESELAYSFHICPKMSVAGAMRV